MASEQPIRVVLALAAAGALVAAPAAAQQVSIDLGGDGSVTLRAAQLFALVTVLSILRQAIGVQQAPPNMMIVSLALFLTYFVMEPVFAEAWTKGLEPLFAERIDAQTAFAATLAPFRVFMEARVSPDTLAAMLEAAPKGTEVAADTGAAPLSVLIPSFLLSEIQRAFEIGFLVFLPFLLIDLAVASILMAMGMMMVPPAVVSLPFKLAFFVVADGWTLLAGALVRGYGS